MAAAGELRCVDSVIEDIDSASTLKEERRTAIMYVYTLPPPPLLCQGLPLTCSFCDVCLRCSDWLEVYPIEWRGIFFPGSVETRPIIPAQWSSIRLLFWLESEYDHVRLTLPLLPRLFLFCCVVETRDTGTLLAEELHYLFRDKLKPTLYIFYHLTSKQLIYSLLWQPTAVCPER